MKRWAVAIVLLILAALGFAPDARATSIVLNQGSSLQLVLDNTEYDTIYVATGTFDEDAVIRRPVSLLAAPPQGGSSLISFPQVRSLTIDATTYPQHWFRGVVRGFRIYGPVKVIVGPMTREMEQAISSCRIDGGLTEIGGTPDLTMLAVNYCTIFGEVSLRHAGIDFTMNTVLNGGVKLASSEGWWAVARGVHVQDAPGVGITSLTGTHSNGVIASSTVTRAAHGIQMADGLVTNNVVTDVAGDGYYDAGRGYGSVVNIRQNRFERCGRGIATTPEAMAGISDNVVLHSVGEGISAGGYGATSRNTVALSGGIGITLVGGSHGSGSSSNNLVAFNAGLGVVGGPSTCDELWHNAADARDPDNVYADPLFCDLNAGDLHVSASSPAAGGSCGPIGALGVGCGVRPALSMESPAAPVEFGVRQRGRVALVTLAGPEPASLELLDVAGRRITRESLVRSGEIALEQPAGVYFMRLTQGSRSSSIKAVVLR